MSVTLGLPTLRMGADSARHDLADRPATGDLIDRYNRVATDLRVSLTDKCNLRCTYCMPAEGLPTAPLDAVLTADEIHRLVSIAVTQLGVRQVRFTGGEPLLRADLVDIIAGVASLTPRPEVSLTTNAIGLKSRAAALAAAGLNRINVSLDSLHPEVFATLTRRPFLKRVLEGIDAASEAGLGPIKINAVLLRGVNDHEAADLLEWSLTKGHELRFIEQMPLDADHTWTRESMITAQDVRESLAEKFVLHPDTVARDGAPAELYRVERAADQSAGVQGRVGIIASVTEPFCGDCRRTRLTSEGGVRNCLFTHKETDLLGPLRDGASDSELADLWRAEMWRKEPGHGVNEPGFVQPERSMSAIGG